MDLAPVVQRDEWLVARKDLLAREKEKELTRQHDELNAERRRLPMVEVEQDLTGSSIPARPMLAAGTCCWARTTTST